MSPIRLHVRLLVADLPKILAFYRDVIGLSVTFDDGKNYAELQAGETALGLFLREAMRESLRGPAATAQSDRTIFVFAVNDVDAIAQRLRARGAPRVANSRDMPEWGIRMAQFRDPEGNLFEVNQPL